MRRNNQSALALLSLAYFVLLAACNSSTPVLQYVTISPSSGTASVGGTFQFTAQAYYSNGSVQDGTSLVTWASSNTSVATIVAGGLATGVGVGSTSITATQFGVSASTMLTVSTPAAVSVSVSPQTTATGTSQTVSFTANVTNGKSGVTWTASAGTIDVNGNFVAPAGPQSITVTVTAASKDDTTKSASATVNVVAPGQVTATANLQVANYEISPAAAGDVSVQFGPDTNYGLTTWTQPVPIGGGPVNLFVAGMRANTLYHMRGVVQFADGTQFMDADQTFTTQALAAAQLPTITATTTAGMTPQSGVEMLNLVNFTTSTKLTAIVTDLSGNVLWAYDPGTSVPAGSLVEPIKLLPNGHFLITFTVSVSGLPSSAVMQEVDPSGTVVWQMTSAQLNAALATATCTECNVIIRGVHHDFVMLPNGHLVLITNTEQTISGTKVDGDVLIDVQQNFNNPSNPVRVFWAWNEFNHLDTNRRPYQYPDWTHSNAVIYSADDGNLIISIRHQNWLVKMSYANGTGDGSILWRLGYQGDFTLQNSDGTPDTNPADWFFAQHGPSFVSSNTTGKFSLALFDNGTDRGVTVTTGGTCGVSGQPACYSTVPIFDIDETAMTATFTFHPMAATYSFFGGNAAVLKNGNVEYCESAGGPGTAGDIYEVTQDSNAQTVWKMLVTGQYVYRGQRIPSLYPGVQW